MVPETMILQILAMGGIMLFGMLGEIIAERSGVVNLGIEGSIALGAATAYAVTVATGTPLIGLLTGTLSGVLPALLLILISVYMPLNMIVAGIVSSSIFSALSIIVGNSVQRVPQNRIYVLSESTTISLVFTAALVSAVILHLLMKRRAGLIIRSVGEDPYSSYSLGIDPWRVRSLSTMFSGLMGGLTGSLVVLTPMISMIWRENITSGMGFIIVAVVPATLWSPLAAVIMSLFFGSIPFFSIYVQQTYMFSTEIASAFPYVLALLLYIFFRALLFKKAVAVPRALGREIVVEERYD